MDKETNKPKLQHVVDAYVSRLRLDLLRPWASKDNYTRGQKKGGRSDKVGSISQGKAAGQGCSEIG